MTHSKRQIRRDADGITHETTDLRNAEKLIERYGDDLRFVSTWGKWLVWDGKRWALDDTGGAMRCATDLTRAMAAEALDQSRKARQELGEAEEALDLDEKVRKTRIRSAQRKVAAADRLFQWSVKSQNSGRLRAMLDVAKCFSEIAVLHDDLDSDPWLLNVANGTIDLQTGKLQLQRRDDLITKLAPVVYDEAAKCPTWLSFLNRAMGGDGDLTEYLQRLFGYALSGSVREHILVFNYGTGANGKSTGLRIGHEMLGDYASPAPRGLLFRTHGERHPTELAALFGRRYVTCAEIEEGQAFDEATTKDLSGGDPISCRRMREDFWSFAPTHKLFLAGNHKPTVRGDDEGIWRRMRLIPWMVTIPANERDASLPDKLRAELPGILVWAVRGCIAWQARGLDAPAAVQTATSAYRAENDMLGEFLRLRVVFEAEATIARKDLREAYEGHCKDNGTEPFGAKRFAGRLRERGVTEGSVRKGASVVDAWRGVRLATDPERAAASAWRCRDVGTSSDQNLDYPLRGPKIGSPREVSGESVPTSPDVPTDAGELLNDWLASQGIVTIE